MSHAQTLLFKSYTYNEMSHAQTLLFKSYTYTPIFPSHMEMTIATIHKHAATFGSLSEPQLLTGYERNDLTHMNNIEVKPMFFHRPSVTSTCVSAERIAIPPPESGLDDEQVRNMLASPLYLHEREASADADRPRVSHSFRETQC